MGVDVPEVARKRPVGDLAERAGELHARGPPPTMTKVSHARAVRLVLFALGLLEGEQHPAADLERVLEALEPGRKRRPLGVAEVRVLRARGDDE